MSRRSSPRTRLSRGFAAAGSPLSGRSLRSASLAFMSPRLLPATEKKPQLRLPARVDRAVRHGVRGRDKKGLARALVEELVAEKKEARPPDLEPDLLRSRRMRVRLGDVESVDRDDDEAHRMGEPRLMNIEDRTGDMGPVGADDRPGIAVTPDLEGLLRDKAFGRLLGRSDEIERPGG